MNIYYKLDTGEILALRNDTAPLTNFKLDIDYSIKNYQNFDNSKMYKVDISTLELVEITQEDLEENISDTTQGA